MLCATDGVAGEVYNLANGLETSILDLAKIINNLTDNCTPIEFLPRRVWDNSGKRYGSTEKAHQELGFKAQVSLEKGLQQTIEWTQKNQSFIDSCISKHQKYMSDFSVEASG